MTDGKKALEELVAGIGRCEHDGGFDREIGPIGCMLGDKCVCVHTAPRIRAIAAYVATLEARAAAAEERVKRLEAAIEPFAKEGKRLSGYSQNEWLMVVGDETYLTVGDFVSANTLLTGDKP